jgi:hypothetical protein
MRHSMLSFVACLVLINGTIFGEKLLHIKCVFWFYLQILSEIFIILRITKLNVIINLNNSSRKVLVILARFSWNLNVRDRFSWNLSVRDRFSWNLNVRDRFSWNLNVRDRFSWNFNVRDRFSWNFNVRDRFSWNLNVRDRFSTNFQK